MFPSYLAVTWRRHRHSQIWPSVTDIECIVFLGGELIAYWPKGTFLTQEHCLKHKPPLYLVDSLNLQTWASTGFLFPCVQVWTCTILFYTSVGTALFSICLHDYSSYQSIETTDLETASNHPFYPFYRYSKWRRHVAGRIRLKWLITLPAWTHFFPVGPFISENWNNLERVEYTPAKGASLGWTFLKISKTSLIKNCLKL